MEDRVKLVRKQEGLTQADFGASLGVSRATIASIESGRQAINDTFIRLLCLNFDIDENWLRTGQGEMYVNISRDDEIITAVSEIFDGEDQFKKDLISVLVKLPEEHWSVLAEFAAEMLKKQQERNKKDQGD